MALSFEEACAVAAGRNKRRYRLDKAWRYIKRANRPIANHELARHLPASMNATAQILRRLKEKGFVECNPRGRKSTWIAVGARPPESAWGMAEGSMIGIKNGHAHWAERLTRANIAQGRNIVIKGKKSAPIAPNETCELARLWPMMPKSRRRAA